MIFMRGTTTSGRGAGRALRAFGRQGAPGCIVVAAVLLLSGAAFAQADPCQVPDNGSGTITLPPDGCSYLSPSDVHEIIDGLPLGTTIELAIDHKAFVCPQGGMSTYPMGACSVVIPPGQCEVAGGSLGGMIDCFDSTAEITVTGTGALAGYTRTLQVPLGVEVHSAPRTPGQGVQDFDTEMFNMEGQLFGDPDFDTLIIRAGSAQGLPSPGHTTLTRLGFPGSDFGVQSDFDVQYSLEFVGAPGSVLEGLAGTTLGTVQMATTAATNAPAVPALTEFWLVALAGGLLLAAGLYLRNVRRDSGAV